MSHSSKPSAQCLTPILYVRDFREATQYYTKKLLFDLRWQWGKPPCFGCVRLGNVEVFFCVKAQGRPGTWMSVFMDDVDDYFERISEAGVVPGETPFVAIINEVLAEKCFPNANPIGRKLRTFLGNRPCEIVGVVANTRTRC
jgi:catechol 2,3-dioxygenase-like lactoylglutathione lyase family enzyme